MPTTPAIFFGHGSPMITLSKNPFTDGWSRIGRTIARPKEILCISAHWYIAGPAVLVSTAPATIHDFGGFPKELHEMEYPAHGSPALARRVQKLLQPVAVDLTERWGYDHGTWTVLRHVYPKADVPVVQLSIDGTKPAEFHYEVGKRLATLRDEGVMIIGSGNIVHNLMMFRRDQPDLKYPWATAFDARAKELLQAKDFEALLRYERLGREAALSVPTPDHYLPLMYVMGAVDKKERITFPVEGIRGGSMSMLVVQFS